METISLENFDIKTIDKARLKSILEKFPSAKVTIFGDLILDEHLVGTPDRISREAPVIILKYLDSKFSLGGAANAAANCTSLGAQTNLIGTLGDDNNALEFAKICKDLSINLISVTDAGKATTTKTRIISTNNRDFQSGTGQQQQVLRIDKEEKHEPSPSVQGKLMEAFKLAIKDTDIVLLSDYSNGNLSHEKSQELIKISKELNKKTICDSNGDQSKFKNCYSMTPNQPDIEKATGMQIKSDEDLQKLAQSFLELQNCEQLLLTRGSKGMAIINKEKASLIPAINKSEVFDVTGAGDTVSAAYTIATSLGASPLEAALIGNLAASIAVKRYGCAAISNNEVIELIDSL